MNEEKVGEKQPGTPVNTDTDNKQKMFEAISVLLSRGYAISNTEVSKLAEAYGVNPASAPGTLNTRAAQSVMDEAGVMPIRKDNLGRKFWVDGNGATLPEEIRRTEQIMREQRRMKPKSE